MCHGGMFKRRAGPLVSVQHSGVLTSHGNSYWLRSPLRPSRLSRPPKYEMALNRRRTSIDPFTITDQNATESLPLLLEIANVTNSLCTGSNLHTQVAATPP